MTKDDIPKPPSGKERKELHTVRVVINGKEIPVKGPDPVEYIRDIAEYVDRKMREISREARIPSSSHVAVLAALNIADEKFKLEQKMQAMEKKLGERISGLNEMIKKVLDD